MYKKLLMYIISLFIGLKHALLVPIIWLASMEDLKDSYIIGAKGLQKGDDPLSPYLFVMAIEALFELLDDDVPA